MHLVIAFRLSSITAFNDLMKWIHKMMKQRPAGRRIKQ